MSSRDSVGIKTITFHLQQAGFPAYSIDIAAGNFPAAEGRTAQNFKQQPAIYRLAHFARTRGLASWVMQWVCSLRDSLQGSRVRFTRPRPTLRTGFPLPTWGRPQRPPGGSTAHLQLFKSNTSYSGMQIANLLISRMVLRLFENTNGPPSAQPKLACGKTSVSVGNSLRATPNQPANRKQIRSKRHDFRN